MKKTLLLLCLIILAFNTVCSAAAPQPSQKVFLFYKVPDTAIQCQNSNDDMIAGAKELEKEIADYYKKRFIVQGIQRIPNNLVLSAADYAAKVLPGQIPFIIELSLEGQGQSETVYQNLLGAKISVDTPTTKVHLIEMIPNFNGNVFYKYDYGIQSYKAATMALGTDVYVQKDPRKNTKNAIKGCLRDACKYDETINKYANQTGYEQEYNRFIGNFKQ